MKKLFKLIIAAMPIVGFTACNDGLEKVENLEDSQTTVNSCSIRSVEDAIDVASQAAELFGRKDVLSRGKQNMEVHVIANANSRSGATDTLLYVVDYGDNSGFAVVSAPYETEALLAVTESGDYESTATINNDGFQYYMEAAQNYAESSADANDGPVELKPAFYTQYRLVHDVIEPKLTVNWGQRYPEGNFCPNKISGCVQTAMAQILSYIEEPTSLTLTYPEKDTNSIQLNWAQLKQHVTSPNSYDASVVSSHLLECGATEASHLDLARLCRELGYRNGATYYTDPDRTGAYSSEACYTMANLLPNRTVSYLSSLSNYTEFFEQLRESIAYVSGTDISVGGHAWVADGGKVLGSRKYTYSTTEKDKYGNDLLLSVQDNTTTYFHFNWGWNGNSNGYFVAGVFDTTKGVDDPEGFGDTIDPLSRATFGYNVEYFTVK